MQPYRRIKLSGLPHPPTPLDRLVRKKEAVSSEATSFQFGPWVPRAGTREGFKIFVCLMPRKNCNPVLRARAGLRGHLGEASHGHRC